MSKPCTLGNRRQKLDKFSQGAPWTIGALDWGYFYLVPGITSKPGGITIWFPDCPESTVAEWQLNPQTQSHPTVRISEAVKESLKGDTYK
jgi:hypothetical protein